MWQRKGKRLPAAERDRRAHGKSGELLMVAFHFPPISGSSGFLRTAGFCRYLLDYHWKATVLTVRPRVYSRVDDANLELLADVPVVRCPALDTATALSYGGRYPLFLALPDRWISWTIPGILSGLRLIRQNRCQVLWTTFPIPTAILIGLVLKKLTKIPWVVDIRDVILDDDFPENPRERRVYSWLERKVVEYCDAVVVTTPGARSLYAIRYPDLEGRLYCIANGFDERFFSQIEGRLGRRSCVGHALPTLVHSGLLSRIDRNPLPFFDAVSRLVKLGRLESGRYRIVLRGCGDDAYYREALGKRDLSEIVSLKPVIGYTQAVLEMMESSGLLLFQGTTCNDAVPAKLYEYFRCKIPILAITDPVGDVAGLLRGLNVGLIADIGDVDDIEEKLTQFLNIIDARSFEPLNDEILRGYSRKSQAGQLASLLRKVGRP